jgi:hypothetical protein
MLENFQLENQEGDGDNIKTGFEDDFEFIQLNIGTSQIWRKWMTT